MEKFGGERLAAETERLFEHIEKEESKQKKAKASKNSGDSKASSSPSWPATTEEKCREAREELQWQPIRDIAFRM